MNRATIVGFALVAIVAASLVYDNREKILPPPSGETVLVLFDLSSSAKSQRDTYVKVFSEKILPTIGEGDVIVVDRISDHPLAQAQFPVDEHFKKYGPLDKGSNPIMKQIEEDEKRAAIKEKVAAFISTAGAEATAIMDSTLVAERVFNSYPNPIKKLVIFSDMVESSNNYSFDNLNLTTKKTEEIIAQRKKDGQFPDLTGVTVYVVGAGVELKNKTTSQRWLNIQNFWTAYFAVAGADLSKDRYGAALLAF